MGGGTEKTPDWVGRCNWELELDPFPPWGPGAVGFETVAGGFAEEWEETDNPPLPEGAVSMRARGLDPRWKASMATRNSASQRTDWMAMT